MKKILLILIAIILLTGCNDLMNTPTKKVEEFFNKYQTLDNKIIDQLDYKLDESYTLTDKQKEEYKKIMKKQYKDLIYTIKEETTEANKATVKTEIEVYDYNKAIEKSNNYLIKNQNEFINEDNTTNYEKFFDYKIEQVSKETSRVKYTLELTLTKENDVWYLDDITELDKQKIHGIYNY